MFGTKKGSTAQGSIDSLIGVGTRIDGDVVFSGGLRVDGQVHGSISSENGEQGTVVISEKASVEGAISVGHVVINGTVVGPVFAGESLELLPAARVTGDVEYHQIEMQQGAVIQGRLVHKTSAKPVDLKLATGK
ncbi:Integral membrane protein CcmA involved in cell shape determination [Candidatus Propionivibrio aalborgensis]|jgi:cytoskeletal protein CcmA (bactofilin family)|uniref:Integral membrane protein CcmA involved in cell shape determination n=1 Tax=Candidatus Propionivibrio aalborgensis TaxID=1860101 RepID=A0A1A8XSA1_9RHOO|nr:polymer-forming cytoskeletal protein [Candidatus Propionivibrio aalborgensis]MBK7326779.1 polymer-forming cytoskeletal protein [Propionivibrio sp.]MBK7565955.1 polymer-forming cytoskeletal protein [Propionivibrio sp.]MBK9028234.1 polymer-forming cytoskeletal protein [Propionivibrio sp.]MBP6421983.1 polymer-forming cytoskeletal protein [Propionivibrio sp.]SBT07382.1 Integral membrane protein CcmA involved in cell shape determination [Candidatus Propionivibrio aalborgensis]